ncbi:MAG: TylF/MycF/NovP-related O-methyltransferase [Patescibacteria group bacterium]
MKPQEGPSKVPTQWATNSPVPVGWMCQFRYFLKLYNMIKGVRGDFVECGLGEGNTFAMLAYFIGSEDNQLSRTLWGFDSFEGWPEPAASDASPRNPQKGEWKVNEGMIRQRFEESGIYKGFPDLDVRITKGFFNVTLPYFPARQIAFLHIDADLYPGYHDALINLFPNVSVGGIVAFDEYKEFPNKPEYGNGQIEKWPGCTKAVDEYFEGRPEKIQYDPETKKYFVMKVAP